jgi:hypothetical protein
MIAWLFEAVAAVSERARSHSAIFLERCIFAGVRGRPLVARKSLRVDSTIPGQLPCDLWDIRANVSNRDPSSSRLWSD